MSDPNIQLITSGIAAVADLLVVESGSREAAQAHVAWADFAQQVEQSDDEGPLVQICRRFRLNSFEQKCLLLALAIHIEPRMAALVAKSGTDTFARAVTVRLALERFCATPTERLAARQSFLPSSRLLRHRLIVMGRTEVGASEGLIARRFELTTPTLRFILREHELSESVARVASIELPNVALLNVVLEPRQMNQIMELIDHYRGYRALISDWGFDRVLPYGRGLTLLFSGPSGTGKTLLAQALATHSGRSLIALSAADLPEGEGLDAMLRDIFSEATMRDSLVLVDECEALLGRADKRKATAFKAIEEFEGILVLVTNHPEMLDEGLERRIIYHLPFEIPGPDLRRQIWEVHLPPEVPLQGDIDLDVLANTYDFSGGTIKNAILMAVNRALAETPREPALTMKLLEAGCRSQLRYALESLTERSTTHLRIEDIVLPERAYRQVREIIAACGNQSVVLNRWGFGRRLVTGKGITVLFDGPPGTGKTFCAEIIAGEFDRALYRVNIPEVVSKWVGETEKHLKAIFQQARVSHAMLLFDEADALFSTRIAETKTSTDRYANMEVNLLLQEIERFPGVCILTTNTYGALDKALIRRIQFRVTFEEPNREQRERIWRVLCPAEAPLAEDVDFGDFAQQYELTGAMIKNVLLRAAYWACDADSPITAKILHESCRDEYVAAGKVTRDTPPGVPPTPLTS